MPSASNPDERVNAFLIEDTYLFKHYFEGDEVFDILREYYNNYQYRFEVPVDEFNWVQSVLASHSYALVEVEDFRPYIVVVKQYTNHAENIFKDSVHHTSEQGYNFFLMKNKTAVETCIKQGATALQDHDMPSPFSQSETS
ncbi:MAG: hypothetical protein ABEI06_09285 [Halobacteriaceae archaeon]